MSIPFRFIHAADLHLDSPFKGLRTVPSEIRQMLLNATFQALDQIVELAIAQQVAFIIISGDLFDEAKRSLRAQLHLIKQYERLAQHRIEVYIIHGNHDPLGEDRAQLEYPSNVHVFPAHHVSVKTAYDTSGQPLAYLYGKSYERRAEPNNIALQFKRVAADGYHIGLYHGNVGGIAGHDNYAPCKLSDLLKANMDYWALGHIHKRQILHEEPFVVYPGNTQGRHVLESGSKGCYIVSVDGGGKTSLQFYAIAPIIWSELEVSIDGLQNELELFDRIEATLTSLNTELQQQSLLLQLVLTGSGTLHQALQNEAVKAALLEQIQEEHIHAEPFVYIYQIKVQTSAPYEIDELREEESFAGDLIRYCDEVLKDESLQQQLLELAERELAQNSRIYRKYSATADKDHEQEIVDARNYALQWLLKQMQEVK